MKYRISTIPLGNGIIRYTIETKKHWWNRWRFIMDGNMPQLFRKSELNAMGFKFKVVKQLKR